MRSILLCALLISGLVGASSACAQWSLYGAAGWRQVGMEEFARDGSRLVKEHGWLPGVEVNAIYRGGPWHAGLGAQVYGGSISYDGHTQSGAVYASETGTTQSRLSAEVGRHIDEGALLLAGIELELWRRDIAGRNATLGLQERYRNWRLIAGAQTEVLHSPLARLYLKGVLVVAAPERLDVRFENHVFDNAALSTRAALGPRITIGLQPAAAPGLLIESDLEWMRTGRSGDAALQDNGSTVGTLAQPTHVRTAFGIRAKYRF
ncbi:MULTISPECIES: hypothetical protein [Ramlibacter]|nr:MULTISPECIES: hypothetical protein [Ramlibacter]